MPKTVIVSAVRTAFGGFGGVLKDVPAVELGGHVLREAVARAGIEGKDIDYAFMGIVIQAGLGQVAGRQAVLKAGIPPQVPSDTINKVCASSLRAVNIGDSLIRLGDAHIIAAGGMESMSRAPFLLEKARWGYRMGNDKLVDGMIRDGLWCPIADCHMGVHGQTVGAEYGITREEMDEWALRSHQLAIAAIDAGRLDDEIMAVPVPQRKGPPVMVDKDENPRRDTSLEKLASLKPAFTKDGTITAGNAPGINDGAGALILMSDDRAKALGLEPLAEIVSQAAVSADPPYINTVPALSAKAALDRAGLKLDDLALIEANEAFAAVALTSAKVGCWDTDKVNVNGGAVAFGHPIGASGARILMTLIYELRRRGGGYGVATICSGTGQGEATIVRVG